jgi:Cys-rich four helix bundle protein (predicted Tat secretion target)
MERRAFGAGIGAVAVGIVAAAKAGAAPKGKAAPALGADLAAVAANTQKCIAVGQVCVATCTDHLAMGMTAMADCQRTTMNMLAVCEATFKVASYHSADRKVTAALLAVCADLCDACAKACEGHDHVECKQCAAACKDCSKACRAFKA